MDDGVLLDAESVVFGEAARYYREHPEELMLGRLVDLWRDLFRSMQSRYHEMPPTEQRLFLEWLGAILGSLFRRPDG